MSVSGEHIRHPEDLRIPGGDRVQELFAYLTDEGAHEFSQAIIRAVTQAREEADLRPVQDVIEAWYRTLLFHRDESYEEAVLELHEVRGGRYTTSELKAALGL